LNVCETREDNVIREGMVILFFVSFLLSGITSSTFYMSLEPLEALAQVFLSVFLSLENEKSIFGLMTLNTMKIKSPTKFKIFSN
jgi:hypothetical protein